MVLHEADQQPLRVPHYELQAMADTEDAGGSSGEQGDTSPAWYSGQITAENVSSVATNLMDSAWAMQKRSSAFEVAVINTRSSDRTSASVHGIHTATLPQRETKSAVDFHFTGLNVSPKLTTVAAGSDALATTSPERSGLVIHACEGIACLCETHDIFDNNSVQGSSDDDVIGCQIDDSTDESTPSTHSSRNALQEILEMARHCIESDSDTEIAAITQCCSDRSINDGNTRSAASVSRDPSIHPLTIPAMYVGHPADSWGRARLDDYDTGLARAKSGRLTDLLLGRCRSEPTLRTLAARSFAGVNASSESATTCLRVGSSTSSCNSCSSRISSDNSSISSSDSASSGSSSNNGHGYSNGYAEPRNGLCETPKEGEEKVLWSASVYSAADSNELCLENDSMSSLSENNKPRLENDSASSLSEDNNPECLQLTQPGDSVDDTLGAYDDWSSMHTWLVTVDNDAIGTSSYESVDVYNDDSDTNQVGRHDSDQTVETYRPVSDFKQMLYLMPSIVDSRDYGSFGELSDSGCVSKHIPGSSRSIDEDALGLSTLTIRSEPSRQGCNVDKTASIDNMISVSTPKVDTNTRCWDSNVLRPDVYRDRSPEPTGTCGSTAKVDTEASVPCPSVCDQAQWQASVRVCDISTTSTFDTSVGNDAIETDKDGGNMNRNNPACDNGSDDDCPDIVFMPTENNASGTPDYDVSVQRADSLSMVPESNGHKTHQTNDPGERNATESAADTRKEKPDKTNEKLHKTPGASTVSEYDVSQEVKTVDGFRAVPEPKGNITHRNSNQRKRNATVGTDDTGHEKPNKTLPASTTSESKVFVEEYPAVPELESHKTQKKRDSGKHSVKANKKAPTVQAASTVTSIKAHNAAVAGDSVSTLPSNRSVTQETYPGKNTIGPMKGSRRKIRVKRNAPARRTSAHVVARYSQGVHYPVGTAAMPDEPPRPTHDNLLVMERGEGYNAAVYHTRPAKGFYR